MVLHDLHTVHLTTMKVNMIFTEVKASHLVYIYIYCRGGTGVEFMLIVSKSNFRQSTILAGERFVQNRREGKTRRDNHL